jgi:protein-S-isoprenylcysteine O-methyltransferase Ste14
MSPVLMVVRTLVWVLVMAGLLFQAAGTLNWVMGWVMIATYVIALLPLIVSPIDEDLARERTGIKSDAQSWDKPIAFMINLLPLLILPLAGLDYRYGWSTQMALWLQIAGVALYLLSSALMTWAIKTNRFFSAVVRIQTDRGHSVVTEGPYRFVRHPGYAGGAVTYISTALILGSWWALILVALILAISVYRTIREDGLLQDELPGYKEYAEQVKYRLIPYVW